MNPASAPPAAIAGELTCPFCHAAWREENIKLYNIDAGDHCESGRFYSESCSVEIKCHACERVMYQKDGAEIGW